MALTVVDAGVLIGFMDEADAHHQAARAELTKVRDRGDRVVLPASAFAESLVGPARHGDESVNVVKELVARYPIEVIPLEEQIAEAAARLRGRHGARLRLPDALVVATAQVLEADVLLTTDRGWPSRNAMGLRAEIVQI